MVKVKGCSSSRMEKYVLQNKIAVTVKELGYQFSFWLHDARDYDYRNSRSGLLYGNKKPEGISSLQTFSFLNILATDAQFFAVRGTNFTSLLLK
jgi:hypothetical protein